MRDHIIEQQSRCRDERLRGHDAGNCLKPPKEYSRYVCKVESWRLVDTVREQKWDVVEHDVTLVNDPRDTCSNVLLVKSLDGLLGY